jgi:hypothetical protein
MNLFECLSCCNKRSNPEDISIYEVLRNSIMAVWCSSLSLIDVSATSMRRYDKLEIFLVTLARSAGDQLCCGGAMIFLGICCCLFTGNHSLQQRSKNQGFGTECLSVLHTGTVKQQSLA